jgi:hypothetical protein
VSGQPVVSQQILPVEYLDTPQAKFAEIQQAGRTRLASAPKFNVLGGYLIDMREVQFVPAWWDLVDMDCVGIITHNLQQRELLQITLRRDRKRKVTANRGEAKVLNPKMALYDSVESLLEANLGRWV